MKHYDDELEGANWNSQQKTFVGSGRPKAGYNQLLNKYHEEKKPLYSYMPSFADIPTNTMHKLEAKNKFNLSNIINQTNNALAGSNTQFYNKLRNMEDEHKVSENTYVNEGIAFTKIPKTSRELDEARQKLELQKQKLLESKNEEANWWLNTKNPQTNYDFTKSQFPIKHQKNFNSYINPLRNYSTYLTQIQPPPSYKNDHMLEIARLLDGAQNVIPYQKRVMTPEERKKHNISIDLPFLEKDVADTEELIKQLELVMQGKAEPILSEVKQDNRPLHEQLTIRPTTVMRAPLSEAELYRKQKEILGRNFASKLQQDMYNRSLEIQKLKQAVDEIELTGNADLDKLVSDFKQFQEMEVPEHRAKMDRKEAELMKLTPTEQRLLNEYNYATSEEAERKNLIEQLKKELGLK